MSLFDIVKSCTGLVVLSYGLLLSFYPHWFLGNFIYAEGIWDRFLLPKTVERYHVLDHLLTGIGYTWVAWSFFYYLESVDNQMFANVNILIWTMMSILDMVVRIRRLYSPEASMINLVLVNGLLAGYISCTKV
jgi:hypothetical protein